jgi:hypothetical protein
VPGSIQNLPGSRLLFENRGGGQVVPLPASWELFWTGSSWQRAEELVYWRVADDPMCPIEEMV